MIIIDVDAHRLLDEGVREGFSTGGFFCKGFVLSKAAEVMKKYPQVFLSVGRYRGRKLCAA